MKRILFLFVLLSLFSCRKTESFEEKYDGYAVTGDAIDITPFSAVLTGEIIPSKKDREFTFPLFFRVYMPGEAEPWSLGEFEKTGADLEVNGKFSLYLSGLTSGTEYFYQVPYGGQYGRGGERRSFTTKTLEVTVVTEAPSDIGLLGATLHAHFLADEYYYMKRVWFILANPSYMAAKAITINSSFGKDCVFSAEVTNLVGREYTYTAWGELQDGTLVHGDPQTLSLPDLPEEVDLGLSVKWRNRNVGAELITEPGSHFAWAETEQKDEFTLYNYKWRKPGDTFSKYCFQQEYGYNGFTDDLNVLEKEDDAASTILGDAWRSPSCEEWQELLDNCSWSWVTLMNSVSGSDSMPGALVKAKNGNWIFLPSSGLLSNGGDAYYLYGNYWSSTLSSENCRYAYAFSVFNSYMVDPRYELFEMPRESGESVRPVRD